MARKKRRRKPGLQRCSICGDLQLPQEMDHRICLVCLGRVAIKRRRAHKADGAEEHEAVEIETLEAASA